MRARGYVKLLGLLLLSAAVVDWRRPHEPLVYPPFPAGYEWASGSLIPDTVGGTSYVLDWLEHGSHHEIWLGRALPGDGSGTARWIFQDSLRLPSYPRGQQVVMADCSLNGTPDFQLVALVKHQDADSFRTVLRAWRADRHTGRFMRIAVIGIVCSNESFGI